MEKCGGVNKIKLLQKHESAKICGAARKIIQEYFPQKDENIEDKQEFVSE